MGIEDKVKKSKKLSSVSKDGIFQRDDNNSVPFKFYEDHQFQDKAMTIVKRISNQQQFQMVKNFYAESKFKQQNLIEYFNSLLQIKPSLLFLGEAPGVHGCAHTGIPFTSERLIKQGRLKLHFPYARFLVEENTYERSAGYIWEAIDTLSKPPILWNVFPLHPYKIENEVIRNRRPIDIEKEWGKGILLSVLELFPNVSIITVGNHARIYVKNLIFKLQVI